MTQTPGKRFRAQSGQAKRLRAALEYEHNLGKTMRQMGRELDAALFFDHDAQKTHDIYKHLVHLLTVTDRDMPAAHRQNGAHLLAKILVQADWEQWETSQHPEWRVLRMGNLFKGSDVARMTLDRQAAGYANPVFRDTLTRHIKQYDLPTVRVLYESGIIAWQTFALEKLDAAVAQFLNSGPIYHEHNNESDLAAWPGQVLAFTDAVIAGPSRPLADFAHRIQSRIDGKRQEMEQAALRNARAPFMRPAI